MYIWEQYNIKNITIHRSLCSLFYFRVFHTHTCYKYKAYNFTLPYFFHYTSTTIIGWCYPTCHPTICCLTCRMTSIIIAGCRFYTWHLNVYSLIWLARVRSLFSACWVHRFIQRVNLGSLSLTCVCESLAILTTATL